MFTVKIGEMKMQIFWLPDQASTAKKYEKLSLLFRIIFNFHLSLGKKLLLELPRPGGEEGKLRGSLQKQR
jgi:hypothetical protein